VVLQPNLDHQLGCVPHMLPTATQCTPCISDNGWQTSLTSKRNHRPAGQTLPQVEQSIAGGTLDTWRTDCEEEYKRQDSGDRMCGGMAKSSVQCSAAYTNCIRGMCCQLAPGSDGSSRQTSHHSVVAHWPSRLSTSHNCRLPPTLNIHNTHYFK